ncbi:SGNH/GDSL hydrolase family protein [Candidatus Hodarchaeum mangrovi]
MDEIVKILCIGDSHTAGFPSYDPFYGGDQKSSYEYWLERKLSEENKNIWFKIDNHGICGQISSQILSRLSRILDKNRYDFILLWAGANDIALGYSADSIWKNLMKGVRIAKKEIISIFIITIPPMGWTEIHPTIMELNQKIITQSGIDFTSIDVFNDLSDGYFLNSQFDSGDGVHLSNVGYKKVASIVFNHLQVKIDKFKKN